MKFGAVQNLLPNTKRDYNGDEPAVDVHSYTETPSSWLKVDSEMEYPAEIHFNQPAQKWKRVNNIQ